MLNPTEIDESCLSPQLEVRGRKGSDVPAKVEGKVALVESIPQGCYLHMGGKETSKSPYR